MVSKDPRPVGVKQWILPHITVRDAGKALAFYEKAFGFSRREVIFGENDVIIHVELEWQGEILMLGPECKENAAKAPVTTGVQSAVSLYLYCDDVDAMHERAVKEGAKSLMAPQDMFWGDRMCKVMDPEGHYWAFATNISSNS